MPEAKFKPGNAVEYRGELWKVSQVVSGPLAAHYLLNPTTIEGAVTAKEDELKPWANK